jgi:hypothetical protein
MNGISFWKLPTRSPFNFDKSTFKLYPLLMRRMHLFVNGLRLMQPQTGLSLVLQTWLGFTNDLRFLTLPAYDWRPPGLGIHYGTVTA